MIRSRKENTATEVTTLLLDCSFLPYMFLSARSVFLLLLKNAVQSFDAKEDLFDSNLDWFANQVVDLYQDHPFLRSKDQVWFIPTVMVIKKKFYLNRRKNPATLPLSKLCVIFDNKCQICFNTFDKKDLSVENIVPKSKGGNNGIDNITLSCLKCNQKKSDNFPYLNNKNKDLATPSPFACSANMSLPKSKVRPEWEKFLVFKKNFMEIVIVNSENKDWVTKLEYSLGRAGLIKTEDYLTGSDRTLVFREKDSVWFKPIKDGPHKGEILKDVCFQISANTFKLK